MVDRHGCVLCRHKRKAEMKILLVHRCSNCSFCNVCSRKSPRIVRGTLVIIFSILPYLYDDIEHSLIDLFDGMAAQSLPLFIIGMLHKRVCHVFFCESINVWNLRCCLELGFGYVRNEPMHLNV